VDFSARREREREREREKERKREREREREKERKRQRDEEKVSMRAGEARPHRGRARVGGGYLSTRRTSM